MKNHKKIFYLLILVASLGSDICFSQPNTEWVQRFNSPGNYNDYVTDMAIDKSGNVYLTGYTQINDSNQNYVTIKYNTQGNQQWVRYYDGPDHREDRAGFIAVDDSDNVFVSGSSYSLARSYDYLTIKYNSNGDSLWVRRHSNGLIASGMEIDKAGNVYVTGGTIADDILTVKYNSYGNLIWEKYYNGIANGYDASYGLSIDRNNVIYVTGGVTGKGGIIIKYDSTGNQLPSNIFPNFAPNGKIILDNSLNIFLGFDWYANLQTRNDIGAAKVDTNGIVNWIRTYHNPSTNNNDYFVDMCLDKFGNVTVTGKSANLGQLGWDIATIKYNSNGDTLWIKRYNPDPVPNSNDEPGGIATDKYGNVYVTGTSDSGQFAKMITIKYAPNGVRQWIAYFNNNNPFTWHSGAKVIADTLGNLFVTGRSQNNAGDVDIVTIKYALLTNLSEGSISTPLQFKLYQNYPNPFNPKTIIEYNVGIESNISLKVYNLLGKKIKTLVEGRLNAGNYKIEFDGADLASGLYFYTLFVNGSYFNTKKLILLK